MYEVELKFPLADLKPVLARLLECGAVPHEAVEQSDVYFRHPQRDFGQTDEAAEAPVDETVAEDASEESIEESAPEERPAEDAEGECEESDKA